MRYRNKVFVILNIYKACIYYSDNLTWLIIAKCRGTLSKSNNTQEKMSLARYIIVYIQHKK